VNERFALTVAVGGDREPGELGVVDRTTAVRPAGERLAVTA